MPQTTPVTVYRHAYQTPAYLVEQVELDFNLQENATRVRANLRLRLNPDREGRQEALILYGEQLELVALRLDGRLLQDGEYRADDEKLCIEALPESFELQIDTCIDPAQNTALEGLYLSNGTFCTQCEPEGFRKITYYPDRPDVLAPFRVRIEADQSFPVLLSNGNLVAQGEFGAGRHYALWEDPFPKPSYLFALVAGDLVCREEYVRTCSGREVLLQLYVEERNRDYCDHALESLKKAMRWDEEIYGLEYDLDRYMIVAVDDFNMGAMENKGLNIFNSKYVLAHPETATDNDYLAVEGVIGHEYFHNWTGNRVTCRDWFQLSLKEGLTVFRDQEFSADLHSAAVKRIEDVRLLRQFQFPEDAGPMAHPVRPDSYVEINNFYTTTVYNKGAEVIRMLHNLLGRDRFIAGVRLYLAEHDGRAATCDDFVAALEEVSGRDLQQFKRWYAQAGTPQVQIVEDYDAAGQRLTLKIRQECPATPGQQTKKPFHIPLAIGLLDSGGTDLQIAEGADAAFGDSTRVVELTDTEQVVVFEGIPERPILSPLRGFSAPVKLVGRFDPADLAFRMARDSDPFNRWEAAQQLATEELVSGYRQVAADPDRPWELSARFVNAWGEALQDTAVDRKFLSLLLTLPSEQYLAEQVVAYDPQLIRRMRNRARHQLATVYAELLHQCYQECLAGPHPYQLTPDAVGRRSLGHVCLGLLMRARPERFATLCLDQYRQADNMTDRLAAFATLVDSEANERQMIIDDFYQQWHNHPLLLDKWFSLQAVAQQGRVFERIQELLEHPDFTLENPNRCRALLGALIQNPAVFHRVDGAGYRLLAEQIRRIDQRNPQLAAQLATPLTRWQRLESKRSERLRSELEHLRETDLSRDLFEIVSKGLQQ